MNGKEQDYLIPFKDTSVKCCKCYVDYWKLLRENTKKDLHFKFDYSIEKVKSFRKYFYDDKTLFHFCIDCFGRIMTTVPFSLVEFAIRFRHRGGCNTSYRIMFRSIRTRQRKTELLMTWT